MTQQCHPISKFFQMFRFTDSALSTTLVIFVLAVFDIAESGLSIVTSEIQYLTKFTTACGIFLGMNRSLAQGKMFDEKARTKSRDTVPLALSVLGRVADL
jgi:hypothetical protein